MTPFWKKSGRKFENIDAALRSSVPEGFQRILWTGVEPEDRLLEAILSLGHFEVDAVPANERASRWLRDQNAQGVTVQEPVWDWRATPYDMVFCASPLQDAGEALLEVDWLARTLVKPGGLLFMHGALPEYFERRAREKLPEKLARIQARLFHIGRSSIRLRRGAFQAVNFIGWCARRPDANRHVAWLIFSVCAAPPPLDLEGTKGGAKLVLAKGLEEILWGLQPIDLPRHFNSLRFDRFVFVGNTLADDPRVLRALRAADQPRGRALGVGRGEGGLLLSQNQPPIVLLQDHRLRIGRRLRLSGLMRERGRWRELTLAAAARDLCRLIRRCGAPNPIVHTHDMDGVLVGAAVAPVVKATGGAWIHDVHEYAAGYDGIIDVGSDLSSAALLWERTFLPTADRVVTVSPDLATRTAELYRLRDLPSVILNAIDEDAQKPYEPRIRTLHDIPSDAPLLLHVGSLRPGRGAETVIRALPDLPGMHFVCVGGVADDHAAALNALAAQLDVCGRFHLHGYVESDYLISLSRQADIGMIPMDSYGNAEVSLPNKLFIYVAAELPVVSTSTAAMNRFLQEWPIGNLCPPGDPPALAQAVRQVLRNRCALRNQLSEAAFRREVSWSAQARKLRSLYDDVLSPME